jgi:hypothetical protein
MKEFLEPAINIIRSWIAFVYGPARTYGTVPETLHNFVGFEVFTVVVMKSIIFWDMTPCSPLCFN